MKPLVLSVILVLSACGTTGGALPRLPNRTVNSEKAKIDYSKLGRPVPLGQRAELTGSESVSIQGEKLVITLDQTLWDMLGDKRTGRAKLRVMHEGEEKVLTIVEGQSKQVFGYTILVELAHEVYDKQRSNHVPVCHLVVKK